jgi:hypothetical protein
VAETAPVLGRPAGVLVQFGGSDRKSRTGTGSGLGPPLQAQ